jgi:predicted nuclease of predicted toxin-antitoxin system
VDVRTAQEDNRRESSDPELLTRSTELGRLLFTFDDDFLQEAHRRQREGHLFQGLAYTRPEHVTIGTCVADLELIATVLEMDELRYRILYLPL